MLQGISKIVGDMWAQLPPHEREPYNELARQDKERYEKELRSYQARFPQVSCPQAPAAATNCTCQ